MSEAKEYNSNELSEYDLYIRDGKIENINGDILCGVYGTYAATTDITFIMLDFYHDNEVERTEVLGFCYGNEENNITDWATIKTAIRDNLRQYIYQTTKRNPMILPIIMEV